MLNVPGTIFLIGNYANIQNTKIRIAIFVFVVRTRSQCQPSACFRFKTVCLEFRDVEGFCVIVLSCKVRGKVERYYQGTDLFLYQEKKNDKIKPLMATRDPCFTSC